MIVWVRFDDHSEDGDDVIQFDLFGRVAKVTQRAVTIASWTYAGGDRDMEEDGNIKRYTILRSAVRESHELTPRDGEDHARSE